MPSIVLVMKPHSRSMTFAGPRGDAFEPALGPCWARAEVDAAVRPSATVPATISRREMSVMVGPELFAERAGSGRLEGIELPVLLERHFELQRGIERNRVGEVATGVFLRRDDVVEIGGVGRRVLRAHAAEAERWRHVDAHV